MRCPLCRKTGFTEEELQEHEKKTGHVRPTDPVALREWTSSKEFPPAVPKDTPTQAQMLQALKDSGLWKLAVSEALAQAQAEATAASDAKSGVKK